MLFCYYLNAKLIKTSSPVLWCSDASIPPLISNRQTFQFFTENNYWSFHMIPFQSAIMTRFSHSIIILIWKCMYYSIFSCFVTSFYVCFNSQNEQISIYFSNKSSSYFDCEAKVHKMIIIHVCILESEKSNGRWIELNWMLRNESNSNKSENWKPGFIHCVNISIIRPKIYGSKSGYKLSLMRQNDDGWLRIMWSSLLLCCSLNQIHSFQTNAFWANKCLYGSSVVKINPALFTIRFD